MRRLALWSLMLLFPLSLVVGCVREQGTPATNVKEYTPVSKEKTPSHQGAASVTD